MSCCPHCEASVPDDIGLVVCKNCGESFMLGIDGEVEPEVVETPEEDEGSLDSSPIDQNESPQHTNFINDLAEELESDNLENEEDSEEGEDGEAFSQLDNCLEQPEPESLQFAEEASEIAQQPVYDPLPEEEPESATIEDIPPTEQNLDEVAQFGNSNMSTWSEGNIRYNIHLSEIDSSEVREQLKSLLADSRYQLDVKKLMKQIKMGSLVIKAINPVKASMIVKNLRSLNINVSWEQYVVQQND